jgi:hypothetical protein
VRSYPTVLDVVDNLTDGQPLDAIGRRRVSVAETIEAVQDFYSEWSPPVAEPGEIRVLPATRSYRGYILMPISAVELSDARLNAMDEAYEGDGYVARDLRRIATGALLYADSVVELDPLSFLLHDPHGETDVAAVLAAVHAVLRLRPLIEAGLLILAPVGGNTTWDEDSRAASRISDRLNRMEMAHMFAALRVAAEVDASVIGTTACSWKLMERAIAATPLDHSSGANVMAGLATVELPMLAGISLQTLVEVHSDECAFADWRAELRNASRLIGASVDHEHFAIEAREVFEDLLEPRAQAVCRAMSRSAALRKAVTEQPLQVALGAAFASAVAASAGLPVGGAALSAAGGALGRIAAAALHLPSPSGSSRIIAELVR